MKMNTSKTKVIAIGMGIKWSNKASRGEMNMDKI